MGLIGLLLSVVRVDRNGAKLSDVKFDGGGGEVLTGEHAHPSGEDAQPLPDDQLIAVHVPQTGRVVVVGYVETDAQQTAGPGERRTYARDGDRLEVVELWLKADGSATLSNANGSSTLAADGSTTLVSPSGQFELKADGTIAGTNGAGAFELQAGGTIDLNGVTIDPSGNLIATSVAAPSVLAGGVEVALHDHKAGIPPGDTGPMQ